jgi:hypothetical protein
LAQRLLPDSGVCTRPPTDGALEYPGADRRVNEQEVADMPARHLRGLWLASSLALGSIAVPGAALAVPSKPDWSNSIALRTIGGVVNPAVLIGFNPQPEPPAYIGDTLFSLPGGAAQFTITGVSNPPGGTPQNFQFLFGVAS